MYRVAQVVSSAIVDKYIGESARLIREMFNYARDHQPCIIFMDEIDAIGGRRYEKYNCIKGLNKWSLRKRVHNSISTCLKIIHIQGIDGSAGFEIILIISRYLGQFS